VCPVTGSCLLLCRKYLLELVYSTLQRIPGSQELSSHLPVSVDNMTCIADKFVAAADLLPMLLMHTDDSEEQVTVCKAYSSLFNG